MKLTTKYTKFKQKFAPTELGNLTDGEALQVNRLGLTTLLTTLLFLAYRDMGAIPLVIFIMSLVVNFSLLLLHLVDKNTAHDPEPIVDISRIVFAAMVLVLIMFSIAKKFSSDPSPDIPRWINYPGSLTTLIIYLILIVTIYLMPYIEVMISKDCLLNRMVYDSYNWEIRTKGLVFTSSYLRRLSAADRFASKFPELFDSSELKYYLVYPKTFLNYTEGQELQAIRVLSCCELKGVNKEVKLELLGQLNSIINAKELERKAPDDIDSLLEFTIKEILNYYGAKPKVNEVSKVAVTTDKDYAKMFEVVRRKMEIEVNKDFYKENN